MTALTERRKCTTVAYDFESLCEELRRKLEMARDGTAFIDATEIRP